mgnify:CR=1 FL=1
MLFCHDNSLSGNAFDVLSSVSIARAMKKNSSLTSLKYGSLCGDGTFVVSIILRSTAHVVCSANSLSDCDFESSSILWAAKGMIVNQSITFLDLSVRRSYVWASLFRAHHLGVWRANPQNNEIGIDGALALADASIRNDLWSMLKLKGTLPLALLKGAQSRRLGALDFDELVPDAVDPDAEEAEEKDKQDTAEETASQQRNDDAPAADNASPRTAQQPSVGVPTASSLHTEDTPGEHKGDDGNGEENVATETGADAQPGTDGQSEPELDSKHDDDGMGPDNSEPAERRASMEHASDPTSGGEPTTGQVDTAPAASADTAAQDDPAATTGDANEEETAATVMDTVVLPADASSSAAAETGGASNAEKMSPRASVDGEGVPSASSVNTSEPRTNGTPTPSASGASPSVQDAIPGDGAVDKSRPQSVVASVSGDESEFTGVEVIDVEEYQWLDLTDKKLGVEDLVVVGRLIWYNSTATALDLSLNMLAGESGEVRVLCPRASQLQSPAPCSSHSCGVTALRVW